VIVLWLHLVSPYQKLKKDEMGYTAKTRSYKSFIYFFVALFSIQPRLRYSEEILVRDFVLHPVIFVCSDLKERSTNLIEDVAIECLLDYDWPNPPFITSLIG
jgi:hypothetical protein